MAHTPQADLLMSEMLTSQADRTFTNESPFPVLYEHIMADLEKVAQSQEITFKLIAAIAAQACGLIVTSISTDVNKNYDSKAAKSMYSLTSQSEIILTRVVEQALHKLNPRVN